MADNFEKPINDPNLAAAFILMYMDMIMREQDEKQTEQTIFSFTGFLLKKLSDTGKYTPEEAVDKIFQNRNTLRNYLDEMKNAEE